MSEAQELLFQVGAWGFAIGFVAGVLFMGWLVKRGMR